MGQPAAEGGVAFLRTSMAPADRLYPNIQLQLCCSLIGGIFKQTWNIKDEVEFYLLPLVAWLSGRTSVFGRRTFSVLRLTCSWWVTTYVGKLSV